MAAIVRQHHEFLGMPILLVSDVSIDQGTVQQIRVQGGEFFPNMLKGERRMGMEEATNIP